ncbi:GMC family oxidoreductase [Martelella sp. HB161492]|uniref:GMC oxidoreductase n=1 Tax=Martelella sp. HB161492 TaxID=2720726 RepID=UPI001591D568|nr:GMC family oxidoreductase [Martelella sp. HB161492]
MNETRFDAMVIGSGAAGSFAAQELTAQGLKVVLVEAGPEIGPKDLDPDKAKEPPDPINFWERARATVKGQHIQSRAAFFSESMAHLFVNDRQNNYTTPADAPFHWIRGRQAGGRLHTFGRVLMRWSDDDFRLHSRSGDGVDWPVSYDEIAPFYSEVERTLGVYGNPDGVPTQPDGDFAGPAKITPAEESFKLRVEGKWPGRRVTSWRYMAPDPSRIAKPMQKALASGNLTVLYNQIASRILTDAETGLATGAELIDRHDKSRRTIRAAAVVLCASPIESLRLLLNSASTEHPAGLANGSGLLGRYFMDQLPCIASGEYPDMTGFSGDDSLPPDPFYAPLSGVFIPRFVGENGYATNRFDYQISVGRKPVAASAPARLDFFGFGMMMPSPDNHITINARRRDAFGIPIAHITCRMSEADRALLKQQIATLEEIVTGVGGRLEFVGSPLGLKETGRGAYPDLPLFYRLMFRLMFKRTVTMGSAIHESGGARMGEDPKTSVLNRWNQSWDVKNLFVTDASAFPTCGVAGTTLTVMALTLRACRHLGEELRAGRLH